MDVAMWSDVSAVLHHSDLNDQNLFHSTIDAPPRVSKNPDYQTEVHSGEFSQTWRKIVKETLFSEGTSNFIQFGMNSSTQTHQEGLQFGLSDFFEF